MTLSPRRGAGSFPSSSFGRRSLCSMKGQVKPAARIIFAALSTSATSRNASGSIPAVGFQIGRRSSSSNIAVVWGKVGLGKTSATRHVCLVEDAIWVEAQDQWTPRSMKADIAEALGAPRARYTEDNFRAILAMLRDHPRAIFIDEADRLVRRLYLTETLRAIHDQTQAPLILIGMSQFPRDQVDSAARIAHRASRRIYALRSARRAHDGGNHARDRAGR